MRADTVGVSRTDAKLVVVTRQSASEQFNPPNKQNFMISIENEAIDLALGSLTVSDLKNMPYDRAYEEWFADQLERAKQSILEPAWEIRRNAIRSLLRKGGFKPSGRSKPAQEYLLRCLNEGDFPRVNRTVDCLNVISVRYGLPISLLKRECFPAGARVRYGRSGENYVFNSVGQSLELEGLICVCGGLDSQQPIGTPVKDSLQGKIDDATKDVIFFVYGPAELTEPVATDQQIADSAARSLQIALETWCR